MPPPRPVSVPFSAIRLLRISGAAAVSAVDGAAVVGGLVKVLGRPASGSEALELPVKTLFVRTGDAPSMRMPPPGARTTAVLDVEAVDAVGGVGFGGGGSGDVEDPVLVLSVEDGRVGLDVAARRPSRSRWGRSRRRGRRWGAA